MSLTSLLGLQGGASPPQSGATLESFLTFWQAQRLKARPSEDRAGVLYQAFKDLRVESERLRLRSISFLTPGKDARGRWIAVYSDEHVDEVAHLAGEIEKAGEALKSISNDIMRFMELAGGPVFQPLVEAISAELRPVKEAKFKAHAAVMTATNKAPGDDIRESPDVKAAYELVAATQKDVEGKLGPLVTRRDEAIELVQKHLRPVAGVEEPDNPPEY